MRSLKRAFFILPIVICIFSSCRNIDVFEKNTPIPDYKWQSNFIAHGEFNITDSVSAYNLYIVLRHTDAYAYNNIWLNVGLQKPGGRMEAQKINLALGSDRNGWEGAGMNDIWEVRKLIGRLPAMETGTYSYRIAQVMRDEPLLNVMSVGLRLEKAP